MQQLLKGLHMKIKHFDDIKPNHRMVFAMLYFAACRSLHELEYTVRKANKGKLSREQKRLFRRLYHKLIQMCALWKNNNMN